VVHKKLSQINSKKATGIDKIPPKLVKMAADELNCTYNLAHKLLHCHSQIPREDKKGGSHPSVQKKDPMDKGNYRPVSILPCLSKTLESVLADQLTGYFDDIFSPYLSAFRRGYSCQSLLLKMIEDWRSALDQRMYVGAVLMDLSKAFDCLPHDLLIQKLKAYGLCENSCALLLDYLSNRSQCVKIEDITSDWGDIIKGVPQGSIMGPLLFNVFVNDIFLLIKSCDMYNYADDNTLSVAHRDRAELKSRLESASEEAIRWFDSNKMLANPEKFQAISLAPKRSEQVSETLHFRETSIISETCVKVLGVSVDDKLTFDTHIRELCVKAARQLNVLRRLAPQLDFKSRMVIYKTFVLSNFNYCPLVWHFCGKSNSNKLERLQERGLRFVFDDETTTYQSLLDKAKLPTLAIARLRQLAIEVFKAMNHLTPSYISELFSTPSSTTNTRGEHKLCIPRTRTVKYGTHSLSYYGAFIWNGLSNNLKSAVSLAQFKNLIKSWDGQQCRCAMCKL
jgi:hypothetical protein